MQIGELSNRTGVSVRALRYYEEKGALSPHRTPSGYRVFDETAVESVTHIQTLLAAGLGMDLIADILACAAGDAPLLAGCRARLMHERLRMTADIDRISSARTMLDQLLDSTT
ncbi:MerR family transcriptional regulator [Nocardia panacis]|uniref:MerR family transcriptional regulator n=1 Tax=Nocardia panacis TaxID=2340916 RepID=A0A3A4KQT8_9NOCA|nr:MerR family transcriptional regulator [Nocardia panacis]RJO78065.1 MerR family transcriptional regulator [Nocardia panacis]